MNFKNISAIRAVTAIGFAAVCAITSAPAQAQQVYGNVSGSVGGQIAPGVYGRIDFGNAPPPVVVYPQPVIIAQPPMGVMPPAPVYYNVPPGHAKNWAKHCRRYNACGVPVYFVKSPEYKGRYWKEHEGREYEHGHGRGHGRGHGEGREH
jgi:hypothetical protein